MMRMSKSNCMMFHNRMSNIKQFNVRYLNVESQNDMNFECQTVLTLEILNVKHQTVVMFDIGMLKVKMIRMSNIKLIRILNVKLF